MIKEPDCIMDVVIDALDILDEQIDILREHDFIRSYESLDKELGEIIPPIYRDFYGTFVKFKEIRDVLKLAENFTDE